MFIQNLLKPIRIAYTISKMSASTIDSGKPLCAVVQALEQFAPTHLAEKWDNVGLLIEPYRKRSVKRILLTNDLTEPVMHEALDKRIDLIISYHPPIFKPLTRITQQHWKERIVSVCLANSIALYAPHTAWDKIKGGVNDWLAKALPCNEIKPLVAEIDAAAPPGSGIGRKFTTNIDVGSAITALQKHIGLDVHVALAVGHEYKTPVRTVALCAGSGGSVLRGVQADLIITGELSHHEILDFNHNKTTVLLCNHSNSERGFLKEFSKILDDLLQKQCEIEISTEDKDPLITNKLVA